MWPPPPSSSPSSLRTGPTLDWEEALDLLRTMWLIRAFEESAGERRERRRGRGGRGLQAAERRRRGLLRPARVRAGAGDGLLAGGDDGRADGAGRRALQGTRWTGAPRRRRARADGLDRRQPGRRRGERPRREAARRRPGRGRVPRRVRGTRRPVRRDDRPRGAVGAACDLRVRERRRPLRERRRRPPRRPDPDGRRQRRGGGLGVVRAPARVRARGSRTALARVPLAR